MKPFPLLLAAAMLVSVVSATPSLARGNGAEQLSAAEGKVTAKWIYQFSKTPFALQVKVGDDLWDCPVSSGQYEGLKSGDTVTVYLKPDKSDCMGVE